MTCTWCDEVSTDLRNRPAGMLCPDCDRCSYCGKPPEGHYRCRDEQIEQRVCEVCQGELEAADERDRRERAYEAWVDAEIDRRKEDRW